MPTIPRFYVQSLETEDGVIVLDKKESRHAVTVLRLAAGDPVEVFDGKGIGFSGIVAGMQNGLMRIAPNKSLASQSESAGLDLSLAVSVIKPERMEWLIEKSCELGAASIYPLISERCVIRLSEERWKGKLGRWKKIAIASCKQCGRVRLPEIYPVQSFEAFFKSATDHGTLIIPTLAVRGNSLRQVTLTGKPMKRVIVLIGPEGDFTQKEIELAVLHGALPVSLGPLVLRSETAALFVLSALGALRGGDS